MCRCVCCDRPLNDYESTVKVRSTGEYADCCNTCRKAIGNDVQYVGRNDLEPFERAALEVEADKLLGTKEDEDD